jgi:hypothetical protein
MITADHTARSRAAGRTASSSVPDAHRGADELGAQQLAVRLTVTPLHAQHKDLAAFAQAGDLTLATLDRKLPGRYPSVRVESLLS